MRLYEIVEDSIRNHPLFKKSKKFYLTNQKFIKENGGPIYRGTFNNSLLIFGNSVENRTPSDSNSFVNDYMIKLYKENNIRARRDNSIFVTNDASQAGYYGNLFLVVPSDDYVYSYIEGIRDFYNSGTYMDINKSIRNNDPYNSTELVSNIKTSNAKQFRNGEICLRASSYLYISVTIFSQFYKEIYNKELDINFFQDAALKIKMLRRRGYFDDPNNMLMYIKDKDNNINVWNFMENFSSEKILNFFEKVNFSSIDNNSLLDDIRNYFVYIRGRYSEMDLEHMKKIEAKLGINK